MLYEECICRSRVSFFTRSGLFPVWLKFEQCASHFRHLVENWVEYWMLSYVKTMSWPKYMASKSFVQGVPSSKWIEPSHSMAISAYPDMPWKCQPRDTTTHVALCCQSMKCSAAYIQHKSWQKEMYGNPYVGLCDSQVTVRKNMVHLPIWSDLV